LLIYNAEDVEEEKDLDAEDVEEEKDWDVDFPDVWGGSKSFYSQLYLNSMLMTGFSSGSNSRYVLTSTNLDIAFQLTNITHYH
jgi:hypothetical protein